MSRKIANRFFREHQRLLDNFMEDFDSQQRLFSINPFTHPQRLFKFKPLTSFNIDEFFQPLEHYVSQEENYLKEQFQKEYLALKNKYKEQLLNLEKEQEQKKIQQEKSTEIEPKQDQDYVYEYQQFRELKNGLETGKVVETKQKMVGKQKVSEKKTTTIHPDGTKDIVEELQDEKGKTIKKLKLNKDDQPLAVE